jgi:aminopeptidase-like protein
MKQIIETLYPMNASLLGEGYDNRLEYIKHLITLDVIEIPSGTKFGSWTVPDEWIVRDAWVKFNGEKVIDYQKQPLSLIVGSLPFHGKVDRLELTKHLSYHDELVNATQYIYKFYERDWGFSVPKTQVREPTNELEEGEKIKLKTKDKLEEGEYEVFIDTEYKPGLMKLGVHTIKGTSDREILLFAHLDHPFQANDNLSAVACLIDLANKIKCDHTIKIIFCPETIGSIGYVHTQDLSKVDFMIAIDICGNNNTLLLQKSYDAEARINRVAHLALQDFGNNRKGQFRNLIGSDEYVFNDPQVGIPGILLSRHPYPEYHTSEDTPDKINYENIEETGKAIMKIIEIWEKDFIPVRNFKGPVMRSKYGLQTLNPQFNLSWDYFVYAIDGKRSLAELCCDHGLNFDYTLDKINLMEQDGQISRINPSEVKIKKTAGKKHKRLSRKTDVSSERGEVS